jgi:hypothetical protein
MAKLTTPLYVIVDKNNVALATADDKATARNRRDAVDGWGIKLFWDHKGDKSRIGY